MDLMFLHVIDDGLPTLRDVRVLGDPFLVGAA
jgi:hypothetical protein